MRPTQFYDNLVMDKCIKCLPNQITLEALQSLAASQSTNINSTLFSELQLLPDQWAVWWPNRDGSVRVTSHSSELAAQEEWEGRKLTEILGG